MKLRSALLAATVLAAPVMAKAQPVNGVYVSLGAGANFLQDEPIDRFNVGGTTVFSGGLGNNFDLSKRFDTGFVALGAIGYGLGNGLRIELEGSYRQNKLSKVGASRGGAFNQSFSAIPNTGAGGDEEKYGPMVNVLYDFDLSGWGIPLAPYLGVGGGYLWQKDANERIYGPGFFIRDTGSKGSIAYQGIVGLTFQLSSFVPGLALTTEYRFLGLAQDRKINGQFFGPGVATRASLKSGDDFNHSILVGIRYAFNQAPPPPPPAPAPVAAPAPAPARTYLVFFDWDRADLTDRARQIIAEAAQASTRVQTTRIEVNGYTDRSGTAQHNQRLSVRRAQAVASELVRDGVPRQAISIQGFGESNPLVPTADGVREPQNRRVEIILR